MINLKDLIKIGLNINSDMENTYASGSLKCLENEFNWIGKIFADNFNTEKSFDMYIEIIFKNKKEKEILSLEHCKWSEVASEIEAWINISERRFNPADIDYISVKADKIVHYKINQIIKNLTNKITLIKIKEKPNETENQ